jgi:hypothetical protein
VLESKEHRHVYVTAVGVTVGEVMLKALWSMHSQKAMHTTGAYANEHRKSSTVPPLISDFTERIYVASVLADL